jgi:hypothetical protein
MAKPLILAFQRNEVSLNLEKIDRSKLYGFVRVQAVDEDGRPCELAVLAGDGHTIIAKGGIATAYISPDGLWRNRADLKPVDPEGQEVVPVRSSFSAPVPVEKEATIDEYLAHSIRSVYLMTGDLEETELGKALRDGRIFTFPFSYRGGLEADTAFLLADESGNVFMALGRPTAIQFVGLDQATGLAPEEEASEDDTDDGMDFSMM